MAWAQRGAWTEAEELALVWGDVEVVVGWLDNSYRDSFLDALAFLPPQVRSLHRRFSSDAFYFQPLSQSVS